METRQHNRKYLAQNFLRSRRLVEDLVATSSIGPDDTVYEVGAGKGIITAELARRARRVIAIETDARLVRRLRERFRGCENVEIVARDFLDFRIKEREYKVFANIPFNQTSRIMRKLLRAQPPPAEASLILQKEAAGKFAGRPRETLVSILAKPYFEIGIVRPLQRTDFEPVPDVDTVLVRIAQRKAPLIEREDAREYREFVEYGFTRWKRHLRAAYKNIFTYKQWKGLSRELGFSPISTPSQLNVEQWVGLFDRYRGRRENHPVHRATKGIHPPS